MPTIDRHVNMPAPTINGLRFPNRDVHLSLYAPINYEVIYIQEPINDMMSKRLTGCTIRPERGPANQTRAVSSLDKSSDIK